MKRSRRHSNTSGYRQIQRGKTRVQVRAIAKRLGIPYEVKPMGEIADLMINGDICEQCGEELGQGDGYARLCAACSQENAKPQQPEKVACPKCGKRVKAIGLAQHQRDAHK